MLEWDDKATTCKLCGLAYVSGYEPDRRLHTDFCRQWQKAREMFGLEWYDPPEYQHYKAECRAIFSNKARKPEIRLEAARRYLKIQWAHHGIWQGLRYHLNPGRLPDYDTWIKENYSTYRHDLKKSGVRRFIFDGEPIGGEVE